MKMKLGKCLLMVLAGCLVAHLGTAAPGAPRERNKQTIVFKLKPDLDDAALSRLVELLVLQGFDIDRYSKGIEHVRVKSKKEGLPSEEDLASLIEATGAVEFAVPDYVVSPVGKPQPPPPPPGPTNDPDYGLQWHHAKINSPGAWTNTTGQSVVIAVCDSGIDPTHPDLQGRLLTSLGWNTYLNNAEWSDINGHGTMVAGAAASVGNNALGGLGVAWNAPIMPIRASFNTNGDAYQSDLAEAVRYAADNGARVINVSFAGWDDPQRRSACQYAWNLGAVTCVAAGNNGASQDWGNRDTSVAQQDSYYMLLVGATASDDTKAYFSNYGTPVDFFAPGVGIYTTAMGGGYATADGTSLASPIVAGLAALILDIDPSCTPAEVETIIRNSCVDLGDAGEDNVFGTGRINAAAAVSLAMSMISTNQSPIASLSVNDPVIDSGFSVDLNASASFDPDGTIVRYDWNFGDGQTASLTTPLVTHAYPNPGYYSARVTVTDNAGRTGTVAVTIRVYDQYVIAQPLFVVQQCSLVGNVVTLGWVDAADNETGYWVERGTYDRRARNFTNFQRIATLPANSTSFSEVAPSGHYAWRVQAFNAQTGRVSPYSGMISYQVP